MINQAKWITAGQGITAPIIQRKFQAQKIVDATLSITGLGYFLCKINGQSISDDKFMPVFSDYRKREFSSLLYPIHDKNFKHRVYYLDFNVTNLINDGENLLEISLGNGWYNQTKRTIEGNLSFGDSLPTRYALTLTYADKSIKTIFSDGSERWKNSEVLENNIFYGEVHDVRKIQKLKSNVGWKRVEVLPEFQTELTLQTCPNERVIRKITPKLVSQTQDSKVYDSGEVLTGWAKLTAKGKSGQSLTVSYANHLDKNGELNALTTGAYMQNDKGEFQLQKDQFILGDNLLELAPKFSRHCFRYFKIQGDLTALQKVEVEVVHTDVKVDSDFKSSNSVLNWIYQAFVRTELCNMHDGFPSDCPHRERLGYTGDGQMTAFSAMLTLDSKEFYKKWIQDIADGQNLENGHVQYTAPFMGGGGGPGGWGGAIIFVVYSYYKRYGDLEIVEEYFSNMLKYVEYMQAHSINGLVSNAEEGCWCLGDWASQDKNLPDARLVNSVLFVHALNQLSQMAKDIGKKKYVDGFNVKIKEIKTAIQKEFYQMQTCSFDNGRTGADAFALSIGLGNEQTLKNLVEKYSKLGRVDTGFIGTYYLIKTLLENEQTDLAYRLLTTTKKGSFGYMKKQGATTINEHLDMGNYVSDCHPMFGSVCELLFTHILGLQISNDKEFLICPKIPTKLKNAKGTITVGKEKITLGFDQSKDKINYVANIPLDKKAILVYKNKTYKLLSGKNKVELSQ